MVDKVTKEINRLDLDIKVRIIKDMIMDSKIINTKIKEGIKGIEWIKAIKIDNKNSLLLIEINNFQIREINFNQPEINSTKGLINLMMIKESNQILIRDNNNLIKEILNLINKEILITIIEIKNNNKIIEIKIKMIINNFMIIDKALIIKKIKINMKTIEINLLIKDNKIIGIITIITDKDIHKDNLINNI